METIKYEAVFGDQSLFDGAPESAVLSVHIKRFGVEHYSDIQAAIIMAFQLSSTEVLSVAMRRIIKTPVWTVADQKAGWLPEVGCLVKEKITSDYCGYECIVRCIFESEVCVQFDDGSFRIDTIDGIEPIETPEELAQRLREEWKNNVIEIHHGKRRKMSTSTFLLDDIYDALLSGELQSPKDLK